MKDDQLLQPALAEKSGVSQGQISNYLNGDLPREENIARICGVFGRDIGAVLLAAWLRDKVPETMRDAVEIKPRSSAQFKRQQSLRVMEAPVEPSGYAQLPPRVQKLVDEVVEKCGRDPRFLAALRSTLDLTR